MGGFFMMLAIVAFLGFVIVLSGEDESGTPVNGDKKHSDSGSSSDSYWMYGGHSSDGGSSDSGGGD